MVKLIWHVWGWILAVFFTLCFLQIGWQWINSLDSQEFMAVSFMVLVFSLAGLLASAWKILK